jgi:hypothetical protein
MWPVSGILLIAVCIFLVDGPRLWLQRMYRELIVFAVLLVVGVAIGIAKVLNLPIANPLDWLSYLFKPAGEWMMRMLE